MADTFASYAARVDRFGKALTDDALMHDIGKMAKAEAKAAASADLGGDPAFSGWRRGSPFELATRYDIVRPGVISFHPTPKSAGPWEVAQSGRNQGNAGGFSGPGVSRTTGETARNANGSIRKVRGRKARRWNGTTRGKATASDALAAIDKKLPKLVDTQIGRAIRKVF